jgi:hypothetical protein
VSQAKLGHPARQESRVSLAKTVGRDWPANADCPVNQDHRANAGKWALLGQPVPQDWLANVAHKASLGWWANADCRVIQGHPATVANRALLANADYPAT